MKKLREIYNILFGTKKRFIKTTTFLLIIIFGIILIQNISCGYDNKFWFKWEPAADIEIKK